MCPCGNPKGFLRPSGVLMCSNCMGATWFEMPAKARF